MFSSTHAARCGLQAAFLHSFPEQVELALLLCLTDFAVHLRQWLPVGRFEWDTCMGIRKSKGPPDNKVSKINRLAVSLSASQARVEADFTIVCKAFATVLIAG